MGFYIAQFLTGLASASSLFLVAAGLSIIFGVTRIVNFAHGSLYMLGAFIAYSVASRYGFWAAIPVSMIAVGIIGWVMERTVLRHLYGAPELFQLVATFGLVLIIQDLALWIWGPQDLLGPRAPGLEGVIRILDEPVPMYDLFLIAVGVIVLIAIWWTFAKTRFGILVRAATEDREMLQALGVHPGRLFQITFFLGAALAGLGGALEVPRQSVSLLMDLNVIAGAFVVVVIGGLGSVFGAFLAAVLIAQVNAFGILMFPEITLFAAFAVMAIVLIARPQGFFGRASRSHSDSIEIQPPATLGKIGPIVGGGLLIFALGLPFFLGEFGVVLTTDILVFAIFAAGLHFMMGTGGLISFGHAAFLALGAYASALVASKFGAGMEVALLAAPLAGLVGAAIIGWFAVRLSGVYLAMLTLAGAQLIWSASVQWQSVTGGDDGILGVWPAPWASGPTAFYYLTLALATVAFIGLKFLSNAKFGYAVRAARDNAPRAAAIGIDVTTQRWIAVMISGAVAGLAGGLYVFSKGSVFPDIAAIPQSVDALLMVLMGGLHATTGPIIGAAVFTILEDTLSRLPYWRALLGFAIIGIAILAPGGIGGALSNLSHRITGTSK